MTITYSDVVDKLKQATSKPIQKPEEAEAEATAAKVKKERQMQSQAEGVYSRPTA